jgi:CRP-like cAMP-binding protein
MMAASPEAGQLVVEEATNRLQELLIRCTQLAGGTLPAWVNTLDLLPVLKKMKYRTFAAKEYILNEGDFSDEMYFVLKGEVRVSKGGTFLASLGEGKYFGEMGAVAKGPRTATVQATTPVHAFMLEGSEVQEMMAASPEAGQLVVEEATNRLQELLIRCTQQQQQPGEGAAAEGAPASGIATAAKVAYSVAKPGEVIITEGEKTDDFYFLKSGEVEVSKEGRVIATLRGGSFFGEMAALCPGPRTSRVMSLTFSEVFKLKGEVLRMVFNVEPALRDTIGETLSTIASARVHDTLAALTSGNRDPGLQPQHLALAGSEMEHSHRIDILQLLRVSGPGPAGLLLHVVPFFFLAPAAAGFNPRSSSSSLKNGWQKWGCR